jgi:hypothetical protein
VKEDDVGREVLEAIVAHETREQAKTALPERFLGGGPACS